MELASGEVVDTPGGAKPYCALFRVEHETRSATNPMYGRPLINRNPAATNMDYKPGHDSMSWALS